PVAAFDAWLLDFHDLQLAAFRIARVAQAIERVHHRIVIGMRARRGHAHDHAAGGREAGDVVDVAVGFLVGETGSQPDNAAHAGEQREAFLDLLARQVRIAVFVEETLFGRQQCALAVHMNGPAFADERGVIDQRVDGGGGLGGEFRIVIVGVIFVAPGVELPLHGGLAAFRVAEECRADVARPGIVEHDLECFDAARTSEFRFGAILCAHRHHHGLERRDRARHSRNRLFGAQQTFRSAPRFGAARPAHPGAHMFRPLRGHRIAVARGTGIVGIQPFVHVSLYKLRQRSENPSRRLARAFTLCVRYGEYHGRKDRRAPQGTGHHIALAACSGCELCALCGERQSGFHLRAGDGRARRAEICRHRGQGFVAGRRQGGGAALRDQRHRTGQSRLRRRSRSRQALRESDGVRQRGAGVRAASRRRQWRIRSVRRGVRRGGQTCARGGGRGIVAAQRRLRSRSDFRDRVSEQELTARLYGPASTIGAEAWNACANPKRSNDPHPFTRYEFFAACEESGSATARNGWRPCHLAIERGGKIVGLLPLYLKNHSQGEYVFDHGWADAFARAGGSYYPKLQASVPFTPVTGKRFLVAEGGDETVIRKALMGAAATAAEEMEASSVHITFLTEDEWQAAGAFGYLQRTDQQFHWENRGYENFDQFLGELSSSKRKNLRKERASVREAGIEFDWLTGADITEAHWDRFF